MQISQDGIDLIRHFEGCRLTAYQDPAGVWTIGYGHTGPDVKPGQTITQAQADNFLKEDLKRFENAVNNRGFKFSINQNQFDALVSFTYNLGPGCLDKIKGTPNAADMVSRMKLYNKATVGRKLVVLDGLKTRREAEANLFTHGKLPADIEQWRQRNPFGESEEPTTSFGIAREVIDGKYGNDPQRSQILSNKFGNDMPGRAQRHVERWYKEAKDVWSSKYGNGEERKIRLGRDYEPVQTLVNRGIGK